MPKGTPKIISTNSDKNELKKSKKVEKQKKIEEAQILLKQKAEEQKAEEKVLVRQRKLTAITEVERQKIIDATKEQERIQQTGELQSEIDAKIGDFIKNLLNTQIAENLGKKIYKNEGLDVNVYYESLFLARKFKIDDEDFFKAVLELSQSKEKTIEEALDLIKNYQKILSIPIEQRNSHIWALFLEANHVIHNIIVNPEMNTHYYSCLEYLYQNISSIFIPNKVKTKTFYERVWSFFNKEVPQIIRRQHSVHFFNQQDIDMCTSMVLTRLVIKLIDLLYFCNTNGKFLGNVKIYINEQLKYIFTINNVFIMQYLKDFDKQCKYLFYLAYQNIPFFPEFQSNICELFMYIFIHFYLFMFILSFIDNYIRIIPCTAIKCRLTYASVCRDRDAIIDRGLQSTQLTIVSELIIDRLFQIRENNPEMMIHEQINPSVRQKCLEIYGKYGLTEVVLGEICNSSPLQYIPPEVITLYFNPLFNLILLGSEIDIEFTLYDRITNDDGGVVWKSKINLETGARIDITSDNYGQYFFNEIMKQLTNSSQQIIYVGIAVKFNALFPSVEEGQHQEHEMMLSFILVKNKNGTVTVDININNSWGGDLAYKKISPEEFISHVNDGNIYCLYYFIVKCKGKQLMGGNKKIRKKTKKLRKKTKKIRKKTTRRKKRRMRI